MAGCIMNFIAVGHLGARSCIRNRFVVNKNNGIFNGSSTGSVNELPTHKSMLTHTSHILF